MRQRSINYFLGSLFSRQVFYAYAIAGGIATLLQMALIWMNVFSGIPRRTEQLPVFVELYIETLVPLWIPPITAWNIFIFIINCFIALWILLSWTMNYERSMRW